jgi:tRNA threonylcarbamoyladenosine biosynthesis protein TsaB
MILCLETATPVCSVALCTEEEIVSVKQNSENRSHASLLTVFIEEMLAGNGIKAKDLDAVAVSKGPGSYTGLRIGVSVAKGIAYRTGIPLIGIDTPLSMYSGMKYGDYNIKGLNNRGEIIWCPMLDARRMEVYYCLFDDHGKRIREISAEVISEGAFSDIGEEKMIVFFGDGAMKCNSVISGKNSIFFRDYEISAAHMQRPVFEAYNNGRFENLAYFEPFYLKDFITTTQKKNVLG